MAALLMILGLILIGLSFPAPGLTGVFLSISGISLLWAGYLRRGGDQR
jgi:hypothetical protein